MQREELIQRRLQAQHLLEPADSHAVAGGLCGLQAQFLRNAVHALRIRSEALAVDGMVKTWTLRGTVHLLPEAELPLFLRRCGTAEAVCDSGWYGWVAGRGHANPPERERALARMMVDAIAQGVDTREELRSHLKRCGMTEVEESRVFDPWGGMIRELAEIGVIAFCVSMADTVHPDETKRYRLLTPFEPLEEQAARLEIARRYLTHYGPVTLRDAAYFLHWTQAEAKAAFSQLPAETDTCEGRIYWYIPDRTSQRELPQAVLLAGFDPLMLGYQKRDSPFLPQEHLRGIFSLAGIVHPAILLRGRVVGRWKENRGKVEMIAFEEISPNDRKRIEEQAARLFTIKKCIWK